MFAVFNLFLLDLHLVCASFLAFSCFVFAFVGLFLVCLGNLFATVCANAGVVFFFFLVSRVLLRVF